MVDVPGSSATTSVLSLNSTIYGTLETVGDHDWFRIDLVAGQTYEFRLHGVGVNGLSAGGTANGDPILMLRDAAGGLLQTADDVVDQWNGTNRRDPFLSYTADRTGAYYIDVGDYGNDDTGDYIITAAPRNAQGMVYTPDEIAWQLTDNYVESSAGGSNTQPFAWDVDPAQFESLSLNLDSLTEAEKGMARNAYGVWSELTGIRFREVLGTAQITLTHNDPADDPATPGNESIQAVTNTRATDGFITSATINISQAWVTRYGTGLASYTYETYIHELGHALGLGHGGNYNGSATYGTDNYYLNDSVAYSIMSYMNAYNDEFGGGSVNTFVDASFRYMLTPGMSDIIAVQNLYGHHTNSHTGNTVYGHNSNAGLPWNQAESIGAAMFMCVYDDGGADTLDFSNSTADQIIDLRQESFSNVYGGRMNLSIARGSVIENAKGGSGADILYGNDGANELTGNGGWDTLIGGGGNDRYYLTDRPNGFYDIVQEAVGGGYDYVYITPVVGSYTTFALLDANIEYGELVGTTDFGLLGNLGDNSLIGNSGANYLQGRDGNDTLDGRAGDDTLNGGVGDDTFYLFDIVPGDGVRLSHYDTVIEVEGGGIDTVIVNSFVDNPDIVGTDFYTLADYVENGWIVGTDPSHPESGNRDFDLYGNALDNELTGNYRNNVLFGDAGNDTLDGSLGYDTLQGGVGDDTYILNDAPVVNGTPTFDAVQENANEGIDTIVVTAFAGTSYYSTPTNVENVTVVGAGDFYIYSNGLDNILTANSGFNYFDGGGGTDTVSYALSTAAVQVDLGNNLQTGGYAAGDSLVSIENVTGSAYFDTLVGNDSVNVLRGENGFDTLRGLGGNDLLVGGNGNDKLYGGIDNDIMNGGAGADVIDGGAGYDQANYEGSNSAVSVDLRNGNAAGGDAAGDTLIGVEALVGSAYFDTLIGNDLANILRGENGFDTLRGFGGNDQLFGGNGNDKLYGDNGNDVLSGGAGADRIDGGDGIDTARYDGSTAGASIDLRIGSAHGGDAQGDIIISIENLSGSSYFDNLLGDNGANTLRGENGFDTLRGFAGNDQLFGGNGNDQLFGDVGFDRLDGGSGNDRLSGGVNADIFVFANGFGKDVVTDFEALNNLEKIDLSAVSAITSFADLAANHLAQVGADAVISDGANTITLTGIAIADLDANDFLF